MGKICTLYTGVLNSGTTYKTFLKVVGISNNIKQVFFSIEKVQTFNLITPWVIPWISITDFIRPFYTCISSWPASFFYGTSPTETLKDSNILLVWFHLFTLFGYILVQSLELISVPKKMKLKSSIELLSAIRFCKSAFLNVPSILRLKHK
jgi:hypothetical protein